MRYTAGRDSHKDIDHHRFGDDGSCRHDAKEHNVDRNRAILELIESGFTQATGTTPVNLIQKRAFEECNDLKLVLEGMKQSLRELTEEVRFIHHIVYIE
jgi:hypothetical protein